MTRRCAVALRVPPLLLALAWLAPSGAPAQDTIPPQVIQAAASLVLTTNSDPLTVLVSAAADEPSIFEITCTYASSYPLYLDAPDPHWLYKTAAVGEHVGASSSLAVSVNNLAVAIGPRTYHSDTLTVVVVAIDGAGNRSAAVTALHETIEMPLGAIPQPQGDRYGFTSIQIAGHYPSSAWVAEWAQADVIICAPLHLLGTYDYPGTESHQWVRRIREQPDSRNVATVAFAGGVALWNNPNIPSANRAYDVFDRIYRDAKAAASPDTNVLGHLVDGSLAISAQAGSGYASRLVNLAYPAARDTLAWFFVNEWNHYDNRLANVGLMFDVWEYFSEYPILYGGETVFSGHYLDRDLDGVAMRYDYDEQVAIRQGRLDFIRGLRRRLYASAQDPAVGRHFLIGGNSVIARCDAEMAALLDHIFVEDLQCPQSCGTGLADLPYHNGMDPTYIRSEFPNYSLLHPSVVPQPPDFSSNFANLAAAMRDSAGGPFLTPESRGSCSGQAQYPGFNEVYGLLTDHVYPIWLRWQDDQVRNWSSPLHDGLRDLHGLGRALAPMTATVVGESSLLWRRNYQFGDVEIVIADGSEFDCADDRFEYRVLLQGEEARASVYWGLPVVESFFVTGWDTAGAGGALRLQMIALANEPATWDRSYLITETGTWSEPEMTVGRVFDLSEVWDTGAPIRNGDFRVRIRARDEAGQRSNWSEFTVPILRFDGYGVEITMTRILGSAYGLPDPAGGYVWLGQGSEIPDLAPPHFLEIHGKVEDGFVPVEVRWQNSLGGEGVGVVTPGGAGAWVIPAADLYRGVNAITITCVDQYGAQRRGAVMVNWDFPGRPGVR
ncbi:MAG: hypothetical protein PHQ53_01200 [Candidatus Krumholzibacteria bacterium]|nr:hypothetical protein [Candidatus Krumholzibacteria bacterium]